MPYLQRLTVYPLKSLDGLDLDAAVIGPGGGLIHDREYCMVDAEGRMVNGKRTARIVTLRATWKADAAGLTATLRHQDDPPEAAARFHLDADREALERWLSAYFSMPISIRRNPAGGFPDDTEAAGPTLISDATLQTVARWFADAAVDQPRDPAAVVAVDGVRQMHRRFRPNLVVADCPAFWEDHLVPARAGDAVPCTIGVARILGVNPCRRCVVPSRDPDTAVATERFQRILADQRRLHLPSWAPPERFETTYRLATNTMVDPGEVGKVLRVGDRVTL